MSRLRILWRPAALLALVFSACTYTAVAPPVSPFAGDDSTSSGGTVLATSTTATSTTLAEAATTTTRPPPTTTTTTLVPDDGLRAEDRTLTEVTRITGAISPKSVVSSQHGLFFAQNMMYRHTITVYDRSHDLVATIYDNVVLSEYGHHEFQGEYLGSPVEAAFTSDGAYAFVSNYRMYGGGLSTAASDGCNAGPWPDSFVYRVDTATLTIDQVIRVGPVPKFLAVSPDDRFLVVSNWCGFDVSIVDIATGVEVSRIDVGRHPRGIAVTGDSSKAYVAVMGSRRIAVLDLTDFSVTTIEDVGRAPRHLALSPDDDFLYVSLSGEGKVAKIDTSTGKVVAGAATGSAPRSMAISDDGTALYVVNYNSATFSKIRTSDMVETEEHRTWSKPIGITYDVATRNVWVSCYSGAILVFTDQAP